ncbi:MAG TPA: antitoxin VapB family protein [Candidatus Nanoarchaeia archaeon]|nr:antitoxin VapB family protein [Candidatus Nanoarchaeia archaeon]
MGSFNISIKDEAYQFLQSHKTKTKSFSDVILSFKEQQKSNDILRFFGVLKDVDWKKRETTMSELRKEFDERL